MGRTPCCDKSAVKRGPWSPEEDDALRRYVQNHGSGGNWIALPKKAGLRRCGKSCRLRWLNYLRPDIRHGHFTDEEDAVIVSFYAQLGSKWSLIASQLEGRTDNDVKNYWNTKLKKRLAADASSLPPLLRLPAPPAPPPMPAQLFPPLAMPTVKTETFACDDYDFLVPAALRRDGLPPAPRGGADAADGSTSASAASSASTWSADTASDGFYLDYFCAAGSGLAAADQLQLPLPAGGYYYPLDPSLSLV